MARRGRLLWVAMLAGCGLGLMDEAALGRPRGG